jgi:hypothetical protein
MSVYRPKPVTVFQISTWSAKQYTEMFDNINASTKLTYKILFAKEIVTNQIRACPT